MRRVKALAAGLGCAALLAPVAPAQADTAGTPRKDGGCVSITGGRGCFFPDGDIILAEDTASDGWKVSVQWQTSYGRTGTCRFSGDHAQERCNYDMREGHEVKFRVKLTSGNRFKASRWAYMPTSA
jgi:hypothetical protein